MTDQVPVGLTIGSSDSSGGAGIQGDIKAFASIGCYAATVLVGVTAQSTAGVTQRWTVPVEAVTEQLRVVLDDLPVAAVKVGTTWSPELLAALSPHLESLAARGVPIVVDPVMVTASGSWLSETSRISAAVAEQLFPHAVVATPNRREAELLAGTTSGAVSRRTLAETIVASGVRAVIITAGPGESGDWLFDGTKHEHIEGRRYDTGAEHGVGCAHSALLAGLLAQGRALLDAAAEAHRRAARGTRYGLTHLGDQVHPVDVLDLAGRRAAPNGEELSRCPH